MFSDLQLAKMPRSNKKKTFLKPLPKLSMAQSVLPPDKATLELMLIERNLMISSSLNIEPKGPGGKGYLPVKIHKCFVRECVVKSHTLMYYYLLLTILLCIVICINNSTRSY